MQASNPEATEHTTVGGEPSPHPNVLEVENLRVEFDTEAGTVTAVDGDQGVPATITEETFLDGRLASRTGSPVVDRESLTVEVVVSFSELPTQVRPGSFVRVDIITRTYENVLAVRAVTTTDFMTADWYRFEPAVLDRIARRVVNEVAGINRVVYDVTSKPPGTIEWE